MAVLNRNFNVVKTLVKHGAEIDAKSCTNETPTDLACERRLYDIASYLMENGACCHAHYLGPWIVTYLIRPYVFVFNQIHIKIDVTKTYAYFFYSGSLVWTLFVVGYFISITVSSGKLKQDRLIFKIGRKRIRFIFKVVGIRWYIFKFIVLYLRLSCFPEDTE